MRLTNSKIQSLQDVMNEMAQNGIQQNINEVVSASVPSENKLPEIDAFIQLDPLLASLNKEYRQAKAERKDVVSMFGANDPMAEVASDKEDSAWCALQTRYLELRADSKKMREVQHLMLKHEEEEIEKILSAKKCEKEKIAERLFYFSRITEAARKSNQPGFVLELWYALVFLPRYLENLGARQPASAMPIF